MGSGPCSHELLELVVAHVGAVDVRCEDFKTVGPAELAGPKNEAHSFLHVLSLKTAAPRVKRLWFHPCSQGLLYDHSTMWTCKSCGLLVMFRSVDPEIDEEGIYFLCPGCNTRNKLVQVSNDPASHTVLGQPED